MADQLDLSALQQQATNAANTLAQTGTTLSKSNKAIGSATTGITSQFGNLGSGIGQLVKSTTLATQTMGQLSLAIPGATAAFNALGQAAGESLLQTDRLNRSYTTLSQSGAVLGESLGELMHRGTAFALAIGASEEEAQKYVKVIGENATTLNRFGGTVRDGRRRFEESFVAMDGYRVGLQNLGYTTEDQVEGMASYIRLQTQLGVSQQMSQDQLARGSALYLRELNGLAAITGASVKEQQKAREEALKHQQFLAQMELMQRRGQGDAAKQIQSLNSMIATLGPEAQGFAKGLRGLATGTLTLEESQELERATGGKATDVMRRLTAGQIDSIQAFEELGQAMKLNKDANLQLYAISPEAEKFSGNLVGMNMIIDASRDAQKKAADVSKTQTDVASDETSARARLNKTLNESVQNTIKYQEAMQKVAPIALDTASNLNAMRAAIYPRLVEGLSALSDNVQSLYKGQKNFFQATEDTAKALREVIKGGGAAPAGGGGGRGAPAGGGGGGAAAPGAAPAPMSAMPPGLQDRLNRLNMKAGANAGAVAEQTIALAEKVAEKFPGAKFTAFNDSYHAKMNSLHREGKAFDFTLPKKPSAEEAKDIVNQIKGLGAKNVLDEYYGSSLNKTGDHFHVSMAKGGIARGPESGFMARLHGLEAVVPLPQNRRIPVELKLPDVNKFDNNIGEQFKQEQQLNQQQLMQSMTQMIDTMKSTMQQQAQGGDSKQMEKFMSDLLSVNRNQFDTMEKMLQGIRN